MADRAKKVNQTLVDDRGAHDLVIPAEAMTEPSSLKELQRVNEDTIRSRVSGELSPIVDKLQVGFVGTLVSRIGESLMGVVYKGFEKLFGFGKWARDGQEELTHRADLLSPLLDYGSAYMGTLAGWSVVGIMPFQYQIGPMRGCRLSGNGIILEDKGLWDIRAQLTAESAIIVTGLVEWCVKVISPEGKEFSRQQATLTSNPQVTQTIISSVVVPEAGYQVQVELLRLGIGRTILGGPAWNRLTVQHISRTVDGNSGGEDSQDPNPVEGPPAPDVAALNEDSV